MRTAPVLPMLGRQAYAEFLKLLRVPAFSVTSIVLPSMFFAFIGLGFALGYLAGPNSAPAVTNLIYLPTAFASGLFFPLQLLPQFLRDIAPYLPLYRAAHLVWNSVGVSYDDISADWLYMAGYTVAFFLLALWAYRRDQGKKFN